METRRKETAVLREEGDVNLSPHRRSWQSEHLDETTRELLRRDARHYLSQSLSTPCLDVVTGCQGIYIYDGRGRPVMDFHGNSVHQIGYRHPRVVSAVMQQLQTLPFSPRRFTNLPAITLAERLAALAPGALNKLLLAPGGASAIGIALKVARYATGRHKTISMWGAFHGASLDAISVGGEAFFRDGLGPLLPGSFHVPWPRDEQDLGKLEEILQREGDIGAIVAEPLRCTTIQRPTDGYWQGVRKLSDQYGALLIFDEIPLAFGRTGRMFCCEHSAVIPDVLVVGKGLGGAVMPIAAAIVREDLDCAPERALGHYTHEKSPLGAVAALAMLDVLEEDQLITSANQLGQLARQRLEAFRQRCPAVAEVRAIGLALGVVLGGERSQAADLAERVLYRCLSRGLSFKISDSIVLTLTPPLIISEEQLIAALEILEQSILDEIASS